MSRTLEHKRPCVLSIAGFDPSAGAGVLADIKTFEDLEVYGFGVCSALTAQNEVNFKTMSWLSYAEIIDQIDSLLECYRFEFIKIGLIESIDTLGQVLQYLKQALPQAKVIWDPILKSSSGFSFHCDFDSTAFEKVCRDLFLITPNLLEIKSIYSEFSENEAALKLSRSCAVLLKGGHAAGDSVVDALFWHGEQYPFEARRKETEGKHGSGCVHSAALAAYLAKGADLKEACLLAGQYTAKFLQSGFGLLGYHKEARVQNL